MGGLLVPLNNDRGMLTGVEQGINNFFDAYDKAKQRKEQKELQDREYKLGLKTKGLIETPDGGYDYDPETKALRDLEAQHKRESYGREAGTYNAGLLDKGIVEQKGKMSLDPIAAQKRALQNRLLEAQISKTNKAPSLSDKQKEMSVAQSKQLGLYKSGLLAEKQYKEAISNPKDYDPTSSGQFIDNSDPTSMISAPNWMKNNNAIKAQAAQSAWIEAFLRDASGAAIPPSERGAYAKDFFPQPGDPPDVVANKEQLRAQKMENARVGSSGIDTGIEERLQNKGLVPNGLMKQKISPRSEEDLNKMTDAELLEFLR